MRRRRTPGHPRYKRGRVEMSWVAEGFQIGRHQGSTDGKSGFMGGTGCEKTSGAAGQHGGKNIRSSREVKILATAGI